MTFVIVGGGPTGVELAGALAEIARDTLRRDFRSIHPENARIILAELKSARPDDVPGGSIRGGPEAAREARRHGHD